MPIIGVAVEKETQFHGVAERFQNTYYYDVGVGFTGADVQGLADRMKAIEAPVHSPEVLFRTCRVWSAGGSAAANDMIGVVDMTGAGTLTVGLTIHAEAAVMCEWETSRENVLSRKVYLRKFIRPQGLPGSDANGGRGKQALAAATRAPFETYVDAAEGFQIGTLVFALRSEAGRSPVGVGNGRVDPMIRTREFRRN